MPRLRLRTNLSGAISQLITYASLGFLTSVLVAWCLCFWSSPSSRSITRATAVFDPKLERWTLCEQFAGIGETTCVISDCDASDLNTRRSYVADGIPIEIGEVPAECARFMPTPAELDGPPPTRTAASFGWPARCVWGARDWHYSRCGVASHFIRDRGLVYLPVRGTMWHHGSPIPTAFAVMPILPIPMGLAVNSAFFGGLLFLVHRRVQTWSEGRAKRAVQCRACGYPRAGLAVGAPCPECGVAGSS